MLALVPRVVDALWAAFEPQLPEREESVHPLGCHRPRIADRDVFEAVLLRLVTGCSWDVAGRVVTSTSAIRQSANCTRQSGPLAPAGS